MSGYNDDEVVRQGVSQDVVNYLQKPFSPSVLAQRVRVAGGPVQMAAVLRAAGAPGAGGRPFRPE